MLVDEIEGGFLVAFLTATDQQVATLNDAELMQLQAEIAALESHVKDPHPLGKPHLGTRLRGLLGRADTVSSGPGPAHLTEPTDQPRLRAHLRAVGRYLETRGAYAIIAQEQPDGYVVGFTGQPLEDNLAPLTRLSERLADHQLREWARQP